MCLNCAYLKSVRCLLAARASRAISMPILVAPVARPALLKKNSDGTFLGTVFDATAAPQRWPPPMRRRWMSHWNPPFRKRAALPPAGLLAAGTQTHHRTYVPVSNAPPAPQLQSRNCTNLSYLPTGISLAISTGYWSSGDQS
jgi:hypothetical protein